jgi:endonuclease/exonuclease/phosphatase family metal-dependent hydrolase
MRRLQRSAAAWIVFVLVIVGIHWVIPQPSGFIALTEVFEPYLVLSALLGIPLALRVDHRYARPAIALLVGVTVLRYGPAWVSTPASVQGDVLNVVAWNMESRPDAGQRALEGLLNLNADLIGIEELQPGAADALTANDQMTASLPFRALAPERTVLGVGLLSRYPIIEQQASTDPPFIRAVVDLPSSPSVAVYVVHPMPAEFRTIAGVPFSLETADRDAAIGRIRALIDADLAAHRPVIVMGDINTTEREPAYAALTAGLRDAHLDAGTGPGFTWRPPQFSFLPFGLLRIDYVFVSQEYVAQSSSVDCGVDSDHCRLQATLVRPPLDNEALAGHRTSSENHRRVPAEI